MAGIPHSVKINHGSWATTFASHLNTIVIFISQEITTALSYGSFGKISFFEHDEHDAADFCAPNLRRIRRSH